MDIAGFSMMSSQVKMMSQVSIAVAKLSMDSAANQAQEMSKMLQQSVEPGKGTSIDISV